MHLLISPQFRLLAMNGEPPARSGPTELERSLGAMWFHACVLATLREFPNEFTIAGSFALSRYLL